MLKMTNPALFRQDETGQWWYRDKRTEEADCPECGERFVKPHKTETKYCGRSCAYVAKWRTIPKGQRRRRWFGGRNKTTQGYMVVKCPEGHPNEHRNHGYIKEHRLVMEQKIGRYLLPGEQVHHINGIRDDNRPENLELWARQQPSGQRAHEQQHCPTCTCHQVKS
jgi:hypothetical protein